MAMDRRLFFLFMRGLGLYLLADAVRLGVEQMRQDLAEGILQEDLVNIWCVHLEGYCTAMVTLGIGGYLFFGGRRILDYVVPWKSRCRMCDYDLRGNVSGKCPECGEMAHRGAAGALPAGRRVVADEETAIRSSVWLTRISVGVVAVYLVLCLLNYVLMKYGVITFRSDGRYCLAW